MVILEDKLFSNHWPLARVIEVFPGKGGKVRVARVRTANSTFKRPITKLALIMSEDNGKDSRPLAGGMLEPTTVDV